MEYFNIKTKEIRFFKDNDFKLLDDKELWLDYSVIKNKIVLLTINGYKIFPKDELGFNKNKVLPLLEIYKPATIDSALKIAKYYKVCPYCLGRLEYSNNIIIDCRGNFHNIKKMQTDLYYDISCCGNSYLIAVDKTLSNRARAKYIEETLFNSDMLIVVVYKIEHKT